MSKALELLEYFRSDHMVNQNTPFNQQDYDEAIAELEAQDRQIARLIEIKDMAVTLSNSILQENGIDDYRVLLNSQHAIIER
jgi:hypothetical protein